MITSKKPFTIFEIAILVIAFVFTLLLVRVIALELLDKKRIGNTIGIVTGLIWLAIFISQFKSLRKRNVFVGWVIIGLIYFFMFLWLRNNLYVTYLDKYDVTRNYSSIFTIPIATLIFYQLCRRLSLFLYKSELELTGDSFGYVHEKRRYYNMLERTCYMGMLAIPALIIYLSYYL